MFKSDKFDSLIRHPSLMYFAVPFILSLILCSGNFLGLIHFMLSMPFHELGHAVAHWMSGTLAIPTFFVTVSSSNSSPVTSLIFSASLLAFIWVLKRKRKPQLVTIFKGALGIHLIMAYLLTESTCQQIVLAAGIAGEFMCAPVCLFLSYENLGSWWSRHRYIIVSVSAISLGGSLRRWIEISIGKQPLPVGSFLFGSEVGDISTLTDEYHWSAQELHRLFLSIALLAIILSVVCMLIRSSATPVSAIDEALLE